jgi:hypothetical protein
MAATKKQMNSLRTSCISENKEICGKNDELPFPGFAERQKARDTLARHSYQHSTPPGYVKDKLVRSGEYPTRQLVCKNGGGQVNFSFYIRQCPPNPSRHENPRPGNH